MKDSTKNSKLAARQISKIFQNEPGLFDLLRIREVGKTAFDDLHKRLGVMIVESIFQIEREELTGPDYAPISSGVYKWGYQSGSVFIGDQKERVKRPRIHGPSGEVSLPS